MSELAKNWFWAGGRSEKEVIVIGEFGSSEPITYLRPDQQLAARKITERHNLSLTEPTQPAAPPQELIDRLAKRGQHEYVLELEKQVDLLYRMARHIRNTDEIPVTTWGVQGMDLLAELRELDPERYDQQIKGTIPTIARVAATPPNAEQRARANHCPTCGAFPVDIAAAAAATPPAPKRQLHYDEASKVMSIEDASAEQRARAEQIVRGVIVPKGHTIIGVDGEVTILVGRQLIHDIAAALPATDAQRIRDEVWEEAARIAEKPRVVFGTPLTAMQELAQDIAAEIRAKRGTQDV